MPVYTDGVGEVDQGSLSHVHLLHFGPQLEPAYASGSWLLCHSSSYTLLLGLWCWKSLWIDQFPFFLRTVNSTSGSLQFLGRWLRSTSIFKIKLSMLDVYCSCVQPYFSGWFSVAMSFVLRKVRLSLNRRRTPGLHRRWTVLSPIVCHFPLCCNLTLLNLGSRVWGVFNVPWVMLRLKLVPL